MKGKLKTWLIAILIIVILFIPIVVDYVNNQNVKVLSYNEYTDVVAAGKTNLVYFGDTESTDFEKVKEVLKSLRTKFDIDVEAVQLKKLTEAESAELVKVNANFANESSYAIIKDKAVVYVSGKDITKDALSVQIDKYLNNVIPESEIAYKTVDTYKDYMKLVESKKVIMAVFGRNSCGWCNKFKPVYNDVANEYKLDSIYYFDSDSYDSTEYNKIMKSDLKIPASCTESNTEQSLSEGFGTPLTLFTKSGKVVGCISGYTDHDTLVKKLQSVNMIKK